MRISHLTYLNIVSIVYFVVVFAWLCLNQTMDEDMILVICSTGYVFFLACGLFIVKGPRDEN